MSQRLAQPLRHDASHQQASHQRADHPVIAILCALLLAAFAAVPAWAAGDDLWLHIHVQEEEGATVKVNLPIAFVESAARAIPASIETDKLSFNDEDISIADLREMWRSLGDTGDALLIDVDDDGESVQVRKTGGYLLVEVREDGDFGDDRDTRVDVRIPERVVEALLAGDEDQLDIAGALRALADAGEGELVAVNDRDARVRIWVDGFSTSE